MWLAAGDEGWWAIAVYHKLAKGINCTPASYIVQYKKIINYKFGAISLSSCAGNDYSFVLHLYCRPFPFGNHGLCPGRLVYTLHNIYINIFMHAIHKFHLIINNNIWLLVLLWLLLFARRARHFSLFVFSLQYFTTMHLSIHLLRWKRPAHAVNQLTNAMWSGCRGTRSFEWDIFKIYPRTHLILMKWICMR